MENAVPPASTTGYVACACCGVDIIGVSGAKCDGCREGDGDGQGCDTANTWHCFTGHCDGSGCTYPGECEENNDTFRDYHAFDRVKIVDSSPTAPGLSGTVTVGRPEGGEVVVKPDGWKLTTDISAVFLTPDE